MAESSITKLALSNALKELLTEQPCSVVRRLPDGAEFPLAAEEATVEAAFGETGGLLGEMIQYGRLFSVLHRRIRDLHIVVTQTAKVGRSQQMQTNGQNDQRQYYGHGRAQGDLSSASSKGCGLPLSGGALFYQRFELFFIFHFINSFS